MDELLEVVSEAVSAMVLYTVDADEKNSFVVDISQGAQVVKTATDYFVDMASKAAEFWVAFNRADMRDNMISTGNNVKQACSDILEAAITLSTDPFSKAGKRQLLKGAKNTMAHLVVLLQQADLYEVTRIIRACNRVASKKAVVIGVPPGDSYFSTGAQELVTNAVDLAKAISKRLKEIDDFSLKRRFEDASTNLRSQIEVFLQAMTKVMRQEHRAQEEVDTLSKDIDDTIEEIITVTKLSAKSPFDLSMIDGLDLKDDDDLQDLAMLVKNNLNKLRHAIDMGNAKEASDILAAVRKGLADLIALNRALAKNCEDPVLKSRYEAAASEAQRILDQVVPSMSEEIDRLVNGPNSNAALRRLGNMLDDIQAAAHSMVMASAPPSTEDLDTIVQNLSTPLQQLYESVSLGNSKQMAQELDAVRKNVARQHAMAAYIADHADPEYMAHLQDVAGDSKREIGNMLAQLDSAAHTAVIDPSNTRLLAALLGSANSLKSSCAKMVENMSVATPQQILVRHQELAAHHHQLLTAVQAGNKKQVVDTMRAIQRTMNDEIALAKAIARATNNPELRDRLDAVCANAQRQIDMLMGQLGDLADMAISDPNNTELRQKLQGILGEAQALSAQLLAACGEDLMIDSNRVLGDKLAELKDAMEDSDARKAVTALKAILAETGKQSDISRMMAINMDDPERGTRIVGYADALAQAAPNLVTATKSALAAHDDHLLSNAMLKAALKVRDASAALLSAATLSPDDEYLQNASLIDADMCRMLNGIEVGMVPDVEQVAELVRKVSAQVKLGSSLASKAGKRKEGLIQAGAALSKLLGLMVASVRDGVDKDPKNLEKFAGFLRDAIAINRNAVRDAFGIEDDLNINSEQLAINIAELEKAFAHGSSAQLATALRKVQGGVDQQVFLGKILAAKTEDPDRKRQLLEAAEGLEHLNKELGPSLQHAKLNPKDAASQKKAHATLESLKDGVQQVATLGSGGTEGMGARAVALAQQMDVLESAVKAKNANLANQALASVTSGLRQQAQLAKAKANGDKAILACADSLEKSVGSIQSLVKDALAKPADKAIQQNLSDALASARIQMALATAGLTPAHIQPIDNVSATAEALKKEIAELKSAIQSGDTAAVASVHRGAYQQQVELIKAYANMVENPAQRLAVGESISELDNILQDFFTAVNNSQQKPQDKAIANKIVPPADKAINSINTILANSVLNPDDRVTAAAIAAGRAIAAVESDVKSNRDPSKSLASVNASISLVAKAIRAAAAEASGDKKGELYKLADKLEDSYPHFESSAHQAYSSPKNQDSLKQFSAQVEEAHALLNKAVALSAPSPAAHAVKIAAQASANINKLTYALESGDTATTSNAQTSRAVQEQLKFVRGLQDECGDAKATQASAKAVDLANQFVAATDGAIKNPADKNQHGKVNALAAQTKHALAEAVSGYANIDDMLVANAGQVDNSLTALINAAKAGDTKTTTAALGAASSALSAQGLYARAVARQSPASSATNIDRDVDAAEGLMPELCQAVKGVVANPKDSAAQQKLAAVDAKVRSANRKLADHGVAAQQQRMARARKEREEREAKARKLQEEETVEEVSLVLNQRTDKLKVDNTAEGKLYGTAKDISAALAALSKAAKSGDKKGMIEAARELTRASQLYVTQAAVAAEKCSEPKLKEQILTNAQAAKNWSVQLKIIAAVKAASDEDTTVAKDQLLKCAKGVSRAVISTINSVEIAAVHKK